MVIHTLRAAGFHSTKPSVLDTLVNLTERYLLLLASTTARHALNAHNDPVPTLTDVRAAMQECGALIPLQQSAEETWVEALRVPAEVMGSREGGKGREAAEKRKREEGDVGDVRLFAKYFDSEQYKEVKRVAGMAQEKDAATGEAAVGVGGGVVQAEDFLAGLMKRHQKGAEESRLVGTVLGSKREEERAVVVEGGPVGRLEEWGDVVKKEHAKHNHMAEMEVT
jgi:transcription initiation factor TFIID subunit 3